MNELDEVAPRVGHAIRSIDAIHVFIDGITRDMYPAILIRRRTVERELKISGEALVQATSRDPHIRVRIPDASVAIGLRHRIIHGYESVDDGVIWDTVVNDLDGLRGQLTAWMDDPVESSGR